MLEWRFGSHELAFRNGYFVGGGAFLYEPPLPKLPFAVVAYDARGREVGRRKLDRKTLQP